jgi:UDP-3-O-[3-hydroxymyristoyl] N-acetylglucosamine deacetylase/3-hydroxyacyl-[acyl-carrier-protein] dehydratase
MARMLAAGVGRCDRLRDHHVWASGLRTVGAHVAWSSGVHVLRPGVGALLASRRGHLERRHGGRRFLGRPPSHAQGPRDTGLDIRQILKLLPHRYPFLLIDRVVELDGFQRAVAIKNVTINEPFFQGHWPEQPIMPGVLQLEAMAQLAGVLLLRKLENTGKLAVLWSIDKVKLRGAVVPGDQLRIEVETIRAKPQVGHVRARGKVAGRLVSEAELKFTLVDA